MFMPGICVVAIGASAKYTGHMQCLCLGFVWLPLVPQQNILVICNVYARDLCRYHWCLSKIYWSYAMFMPGICVVAFGASAKYTGHMQCLCEGFVSLPLVPQQNILVICNVYAWDLCGCLWCLSKIYWSYAMFMPGICVVACGASAKYTGHMQCLRLVFVWLPFVPQQNILGICNVYAWDLCGCLWCLSKIYWSYAMFMPGICVVAFGASEKYTGHMQCLCLGFVWLPLVPQQNILVICNVYAWDLCGCLWCLRKIYWSYAMFMPGICVVAFGASAKYTGHMQCLCLGFVWLPLVPQQNILVICNVYAWDLCGCLWCLRKIYWSYAMFMPGICVVACGASAKYAGHMQCLCQGFVWLPLVPQQNILVICNVYARDLCGCLWCLSKICWSYAMFMPGICVVACGASAKYAGHMQCLCQGFVWLPLVPQQNILVICNVYARDLCGCLWCLSKICWSYAMFMPGICVVAFGASAKYTGHMQCLCQGFVWLPLVPQPNILVICNVYARDLCGCHWCLSKIYWSYAMFMARICVVAFGASAKYTGHMQCLCQGFVWLRLVPQQNILVICNVYARDLCGCLWCLSKIYWSYAMFMPGICVVAFGASAKYTGRMQCLCQGFVWLRLVPQQNILVICNVYARDLCGCLWCLSKIYWSYAMFMRGICVVTFGASAK